jgi:hypothetical protein
MLTMTIRQLGCTHLRHNYIPNHITQEKITTQYIKGIMHKSTKRRNSKHYNKSRKSHKSRTNVKSTRRHFKRQQRGHGIFTPEPLVKSSADMHRLSMAITACVANAMTNEYRKHIELRGAPLYVPKATWNDNNGNQMTFIQTNDFDMKACIVDACKNGNVYFRYGTLLYETRDQTRVRLPCMCIFTASFDRDIDDVKPDTIRIQRIALFDRTIGENVSLDNCRIGSCKIFKHVVDIYKYKNPSPLTRDFYFYEFSNLKTPTDLISKLREAMRFDTIYVYENGQVTQVTNANTKYRDEIIPLSVLLNKFITSTMLQNSPITPNNQ